jgi:hypothetical protein
MASVFQNNRVAFRFLPENRDAHDPVEPCISSKIPRLNGNCPAQLPEKWLGKQGPEPGDFIPNMLAFAPSLLI